MSTAVSGSAAMKDSALGPSGRLPPLAGVRVLDLSRLLPGPLATLHLANLGANVIKIEAPPAGDAARLMGADGAGEPSALFELLNRNKRGLCLDLKQSGASELFLELAAGADVVVESFRPGVADRLGVGFDAVRAKNPRVVYCAITGYGQTGPWRDRAGHDLNYIALTGLLDQNRCANGEPVIPGFQVGDILGGALTAVMAILAALLDARLRGAGRYVDVAMTDSVLAHSLLALAALARPDSPTDPRRLLTGDFACYATYRTADGRHLAVAALEVKFWRALCDLLQRPDLEPKHLVGGEEEQAVKAELARIFAARPLAEWQELLASTDCCVTPVLSPQEAMAHPQLRWRGVASGDEGGLAVGLPFGMSDAAPAPARAAPRLGEHSVEILREAGLSEGEIAALRADGVIVDLLSA